MSSDSLAENSLIIFNNIVTLFFILTMAIVALDYFVANVRPNAESNTNPGDDGRLVVDECMEILAVVLLLVGSIIRLVVNTKVPDNQKFNYDLEENICKEFNSDTFHQFQWYDVLFLVSVGLPFIFSVIYSMSILDSFEVISIPSWLKDILDYEVYSYFY